MFVDIILQLKKKQSIKHYCSRNWSSIPMAQVYYFKELNCNNVNLTWDYERVMTNLQTISVMIYQQLSTDIRGNPN